MILPDVRGLHPYYEELALRFAERGIDALAIDWFGRTAGAEPRGDDFDHMTEVARTTWAGISADIVAAVEEIGSPDEDRPAPRAVFTLGFCMGGRMSFLAATLGLPLAGVMAMYGTVRGAWRNDAPAPLDEAPRFGAPVLGLFGGADTATDADAVAAFEAALNAERHRAPDRDLPGRPTQLLRPQGGRVRRRERRGLVRSARLRADPHAIGGRPIAGTARRLPP